MKCIHVPWRMFLPNELRLTCRHALSLADFTLKMVVRTLCTQKQTEPWRVQVYGRAKYDLVDVDDSHICSWYFTLLKLSLEICNCPICILDLCTQLNLYVCITLLQTYTSQHKDLGMHLFWSMRSSTFGLARGEISLVSTAVERSCVQLPMWMCSTAGLECEWDMLFVLGVYIGYQQCLRTLQ